MSRAHGQINRLSDPVDLLQDELGDVRTGVMPHRCGVSGAFFHKERQRAALIRCLDKNVPTFIAKMGDIHDGGRIIRQQANLVSG